MMFAMCIVIKQPDYGNAERRIYALSAVNIRASIAPAAHQRISQPKFFKPYRGFAGSLVRRKSLRMTMT